MDDALTRQAAKAVEALEALRRAALEETVADVDDDGFTVTWRPGTSGEELAAQAREWAEAAASKLEAVRPGRVYCYACSAADCAHSAPGESDEVFCGYDSTGSPIWKDLFRMLLTVEDPRTEGLFQKPPDLLARVVGRRRLIEEQLDTFGKSSLTYRVWGQVVAGYLVIDGQRHSLTLQVVETKDHQLHFQVVADESLRHACLESPTKGNSILTRLRDALAKAEKDIHTLSQSWRLEREKMTKNDVKKKVFSRLRRLANALERLGRQKRRRTKHAEARARDQRPVHKARDDVAKANDEDFFRDRAKNTFVVVGRGGRAHVFNERGRHVTSLIFNSDEQRKRQRRKRYVPLNSEEIQTLRNAVLNPTPPTRDSRDSQ